MSYIKRMFEAHPVNPSSDHAVNMECITAAYACAEACNACADACLGEKDVAAMVECIRNCTDCADVCLTTARNVSRFTRTDKKLAGALLRACIEACGICGATCSKHGEMMEHCRVCAEACARCKKACDALLAE
ncbi:MAG: four-helix bundle copper-binding protein [Chthoniobacterales bacterium]